MSCNQKHVSQPGRTHKLCNRSLLPSLIDLTACAVPQTGMTGLLWLMEWLLDVIIACYLALCQCEVIKLPTCAGQYGGMRAYMCMHACACALLAMQSYESMTRWCCV